MNTIDVFYIIGTICIVAVSVVFSILAFQAMQVLRDVNRIAANVEQISVLAEQVAQVVFPGILHAAKKIDKAERKVAKFIEDKTDIISKI